MGSLRRLIARASLVLAFGLTLAAITLDQNFATPMVTWFAKGFDAHAQTSAGATATRKVVEHPNLVLIATVLVLLLVSVLLARHKKKMF